MVAPKTTAPPGGSDRAEKQMKSSAAAALATQHPRIAKAAVVLLQMFWEKEKKFVWYRPALSHFCHHQVAVAALMLMVNVKGRTITYQHIRDTVQNLFALHALVHKKSPVIAKELGASIHDLTLMVGELGKSLEELSGVPCTDWMAVSEAIVAKTQDITRGAQLRTSFYETEGCFPKMTDFTSIKLLRAANVRALYRTATYKVLYRPANLTCVMKLFDVSRALNPSSAPSLDSVVASLTSSPFLVKHYACFTALKTYVTISEFVRGASLDRVLKKVGFLSIEECRVVMGQLILAVQHMHDRALMHNDIKTSNILIMPGGRIKLIDSDNTAMCYGRFSNPVSKCSFNLSAPKVREGDAAKSSQASAPQIYTYRPYGPGSDWWSAGVAMYEMMTGRVAYELKTIHRTPYQVINEPLLWPNIEEHPHSATPQAKDLVFLMLQKNPDDLAGFKKYAGIRQHLFFDGFDWKRLATSKDLCRIPAVEECMKNTEEIQSPTTDATVFTVASREVLKFEDVEDIKGIRLANYFTYFSPGFKKMMQMVKEQTGPVVLDESFFSSDDTESDDAVYKKASEVDSDIEFGNYIETATLAVKPITAQETIDIALFRTKTLGKYRTFGIHIMECVGETQKKFFIVEGVKRGSPAEVSRVLVGDVIVAVNGQDIAGLPIEEVRRRMEDYGDRLAVTVLSSSASRLLESRPDWDQIMTAAGKDTLELLAVDTACSGIRTYGLAVFEAKAWNSEKKSFVHCHVIHKVHGAHIASPKKQLYPGDVLLMLDGVPVVGMDMKVVKATLAKAGNELEVTIAPISPLRLKGPPYVWL